MLFLFVDLQETLKIKAFMPLDNKKVVFYLTLPEFHRRIGNGI